MLKKLSMSFYAEDTMKMNKQIIFDDCDCESDIDQFGEISSSIVIKRKEGSDKTAKSLTKSRKATPEKRKTPTPVKQTDEFRR